MHLRQTGFTYSACEYFTKKQGKNTKVSTDRRDSRYICQNELGEACFQHDMADQDLKDLTRRTTSDKYCVIKHLILLKTQNMMD